MQEMFESGQNASCGGVLSFVFGSAYHPFGKCATSVSLQQWRCSVVEPDSRTTRKPRRKWVMKTDLNVDICDESRDTSSAIALFLHGFLMDMTLFDEMLGHGSPLLNQARCARMDLRGFGKSPNPKAPYSHLEDIAAVQAMTGKGPAHIVGCDMGGTLALEYALKFPDRVKSISLISSGLPGHEWNRGEKAYFEFPKFEEPEGTPPESDERKAVGRQLARIWVMHSPEWALGFRKNDLIKERLQNMFRSYGAFHFWGDHDVEPDPSAFDEPLRLRLQHVKPPILVMAGEKERDGVYADFGTIANDIIRRVPSPAFDSRTVKWLQDTGHFGALEAGPQCCKIISEFWASLDK